MYLGVKYIVPESVFKLKCIVPANLEVFLNTLESKIFFGCLSHHIATKCILTLKIRLEHRA